MSDGLPPVAPPDFGDGYDWMAKLGHGWQPVPGWGRDGWDLGDWPYAVVARFDGDGLHGLATYVEGDIEVRSFPSRQGRDSATDRIAAFHWRHAGSGPDDLPASDDELAPHHRGPYSRQRPDREPRL